MNGVETLGINTQFEIIDESLILVHTLLFIEFVSLYARTQSKPATCTQLKVETFDKWSSISM